MMQTTKRELLEERLERRYKISFTGDGDPYLPGSYFIGAVVVKIPQTNDCIFSLTQIPGESGFHVRMAGVKVTPVTHTSFSKFPKWLVPVVKLLGAKI